MAPTLDRRGPDDRRSPLLAASEVGRERGGPEVPAHRAGGRNQVRGTGLRAALARVNIAVTSIVVLAFIAALALIVSNLARDRAIGDAQARAALVVAVLSVTNDPAAVQRAIAASGDTAADRVGVHGLARELEGARHATDEDIDLAANRAAVVDVRDGLAYLRPVDIGNGARAVVEVYVPNSDLSRGVNDAW